MDGMPGPTFSFHHDLIGVDNGFAVQSPTPMGRPPGSVTTGRAFSVFRAYYFG
jgi:hypothetical protein